MHIIWKAAFACVLASTAQAETFNITIASGHPPVIPWTGALDDLFIAEVNKTLAETGNHSINWNRAYSGTAAKIGGVLEAIEDGIVDMGLVGAVFEPSNLPLNNVMIFAPFNGVDVTDSVKIMDNLMATFPEMSDAWAKHNQVFLASVGVDNFDLFTKEKIESLNDLSGMTIGAAGPNLNWLRGADITGTQVNLTTVYNDMESGIYEGILLFPSSAAAIKLQEVAPYHLKVGFGANAWGGLSINQDVWDDMPQEVQAAIQDAAIHYRDALAERLKVDGIAGLETMQSLGLTTTELSSEQRIEWAQSLPDIATEWAEPLEADSLPANEIIAAYTESLRAGGAEIVRDWGAKAE